MQGNLRLKLAFLFAAVGGGLLIYGALQWRQLPQYSDQDIDSSIELNLGLDLARLGPDRQPPPDKIEFMRKTIRAEIDAQIAQDRERVQGWLLGGAALLVIGLMQALTQRYLGRNTARG